MEVVLQEVIQTQNVKKIKSLNAQEKTVQGLVSDSESKTENYEKKIHSWNAFQKLCDRDQELQMVS